MLFLIFIILIFIIPLLYSILPNYLTNKNTSIFLSIIYY